LSESATTLMKIEYFSKGDGARRFALIVQFGLVAALCMIALPPAQAAMWHTNSPLLNVRSGHTSTLLPNGKVLVAGGSVNNGIGGTNRAELFDPANGTWAATGSMTNGRTRHTATLLANGKVLVAGGLSSGSSFYLASAELYDPASGTWSPTGSLNVERIDHTATLLADGRVLAAGGQNNNQGVLNVAEVYDPATDNWTLTGVLNGRVTPWSASVPAIVRSNIVGPGVLPATSETLVLSSAIFG